MSPRDDGKRASVVADARGGPRGVTEVTNVGGGMMHNGGGAACLSVAPAGCYTFGGAVSSRALESRSRAVNSLRAENSRWYRTSWSNLKTPPPTPTIHQPKIFNSA